MSQSRMAAAALLALGVAACADQPSAPSSEPRPEPLALQQVQEQIVPGEILVRWLLKRLPTAAAAAS